MNSSSYQESLQGLHRLPRLLYHHARLGPRCQEASPYRWTEQDSDVQPRNRRCYAPRSLPAGHCHLHVSAHRHMAVLRVPSGRRWIYRDVAEQQHRCRRDREEGHDQPQRRSVDTKQHRPQDHGRVLWLGVVWRRYQHLLVRRHRS